MPQNASGYLALTGVVALISFLAYGSQFLFRYVEPHALQQKQAFIFNALVACIWITYTRASFTNPGWVPRALNLDHSASRHSPPLKKVPRWRWCRKCEALKPPRAHHCKICQRCTGSHLRYLRPNSDGSLQVYTKDGSPLPVDHQLCFSSHLSSFPPLPILCNSINDIP